jgi:hypothetical protein
VGLNPAGSMDVSVVCCTVKTNSQVGTIRTKEEVRKKYKARTREGFQKKNQSGGEILHNRPDRLWGPHGSCTGSLALRQSGRDVTLTTHPPLTAEVKERLEL